MTRPLADRRCSSSCPSRCPREASFVLAHQAKRADGVLVFRGLAGATLREMVERVEPLAKTGASIQIDPDAFARFGVEVVPTFVLAGKQPRARRLRAPHARESKQPRRSPPRRSASVERRHDPADGSGQGEQPGADGQESEEPSGCRIVALPLVLPVLVVAAACAPQDLGPIGVRLEQWQPGVLREGRPAAGQAGHAHDRHRLPGVRPVVQQQRPDQRQGLRVGRGVRRGRAARLLRRRGQLGQGAVQQLLQARARRTSTSTSSSTGSPPRARSSTSPTATTTSSRSSSPPRAPRSPMPPRWPTWPTSTSAPPSGPPASTTSTR